MSTTDETPSLIDSRIRRLQGPVLVLGASGFIGANLFRMLLRSREDVHGTTSRLPAWRLNDLPADRVHAVDLLIDSNLDALQRYKHATLKRGAISFEIFGTGRRVGKTTVNGRVDWRALAGDSAAYHKVPGKDSGDMLLGDNARALAAILSIRLARARKG